MKVTQIPQVHAANLVENSGNTAYGVDVIMETPQNVMKIIEEKIQNYICREK